MDVKTVIHNELKHFFLSVFILNVYRMGPLFIYFIFVPHMQVSPPWRKGPIKDDNKLTTFSNGMSSQLEKVLFSAGDLVNDNYVDNILSQYWLWSQGALASS